MNATDLISLLRGHPKACEALGLTFTLSDEIHSGDFLHLHSYEDGVVPVVLVLQRFRRWLAGAAQEWCDEKRIEIARIDNAYDVLLPRARNVNGETVTIKSMWLCQSNTRLEGCLAAIEAHEGDG